MRRYKLYFIFDTSQSLLILSEARALDHTSGVCLHVKTNPKIALTKSKVFSEGNGPNYENEFGSGETTIVGILRVVFKTGFEEMDYNHFDTMKNWFDQQDK